MTQSGGTPREEWRRHWPLVIASTAGFSFPATATYSLGLFMDPLNAEFGWSRSDVSSGLFVLSVVAVLFAPAVGALIDRFGPRRIGIPGIILAMISIASFSLANGSIPQWLGLWFVFSVAVLFAKPTVWSAAVSNAFSAGRGLALGVVLCGTAISQTLTPIIAQQLIDHHGWRFAYRAIAAGWGGLVLVLLLLFFHDAGRGAQRSKAGQGQARTAVALPGLTFGEALRSRQLAQIAAAITIGSLVSVGISIHLVPILGEAGLSRGQAAQLAGLAGIAGIAGKLLTGGLLDRFRGNLVPFISFALPAAAQSLLYQKSASVPLAAVTVVLMGYAAGAAAQSGTYLVTRYGGMRSFGKIYGIIVSLIGLSLGIGPWVTGKMFDISGDYSMVLLIGIPGNILAGLLVIGLGPYPKFEPVPPLVEGNAALA